MLLLAVVLGTLAGLVAAEFDPQLHAKYLTMSESSFIEYFNAQGYSWKMAEYDNTLEKFVYCVLSDNETINKLPLQTHDLEGIELPDNFDARQQWPQCESIKEVSNQGSCGSCWAFAGATTASDRTCIHKDVHVRLSIQDYDTCVWGEVCSGGDLTVAFFCWQDKGLVTQECKPYNILDLILQKHTFFCENGAFYMNDKHYADTIFRLPNNNDQIKAELTKNGPVATEFTVFEDFLKYKSGIYEHSHGEVLGTLDVRVIGYGVDNGTEYWLAANSWGDGWGERGFFKIKTNQQELEFESSFFSGMPMN